MDLGCFHLRVSPRRPSHNEDYDLELIEDIVKKNKGSEPPKDTLPDSDEAWE